MSGWGCVHDDHGTCTRVAGRPCDPGMKGCVLAGRFRFTNPAKNRQPRPATGHGVDTVDRGDDPPPETVS